MFLFCQWFSSLFLLRASQEMFISWRTFYLSNQSVCLVEFRAVLVFWMTTKRRICVSSRKMHHLFSILRPNIIWWHTTKPRKHQKVTWNSTNNLICEENIWYSMAVRPELKLTNRLIRGILESCWMRYLFSNYFIFQMRDHCLISTWHKKWNSIRRMWQKKKHKYKQQPKKIRARKKRNISVSYWIKWIANFIHWE